MTVGSYIKDITDTVKSVFEGMSITLSHLVRRPMTIQYPDKIPAASVTQPYFWRKIAAIGPDGCL